MSVHKQPHAGDKGKGIPSELCTGSQLLFSHLRIQLPFPPYLDTGCVQAPLGGETRGDVQAPRGNEPVICFGYRGGVLSM